MPIFLRRVIFILTLLTGAYFLAAPFIVPWLVNGAVRQAMETHVKGSLSYGQIAFNPFSLRFTVRGVDLKDEAGSPVFSADAIKLNLSWRSLWADRIRLDDLLFERPELKLAFLEGGGTTLDALWVPGEGGGTSKGVWIDRLRATAATVTLGNYNGHSLVIGPTDLDFAGFGSSEGHAIDFERFAFEIGGGKVLAEGRIERDPLEATLDLTLEHVPVTAIAGFIPFRDITPEAGELSGKATLVIGDAFDVKADASIHDLVTTTSSQMLHRLVVPYVNATGFHYSMEANALSAETLQLDGGSAVLVRFPRDQVIAAEPVGEEGMPQLFVRRIMINDGHLVFEDRTFDPVVQTPFEGVSGIFSDFMLDDRLITGFQGQARTGPNSLLTVDGYVDYGDTLTASVRANVDQLEHSVLSPYLQRAVGRGTEAGQAYLKFDYYIAENEIDGINTFLFDRWKWAEKDPAYQGDDVPIKKAFNILEGKGGRVEMEIPVEGEVLDPTFRMEKLVRRATNKVVKNIITTPFRIIGKLIPGGGKDDIDLDKVKFEPTSAELVPLEKARLHALAQALLERPKLRLEIIGMAIDGVDVVPPKPQVEEPAVEAEAVVPPDDQPAPAEGPAPAEAAAETPADPAEAPKPAPVDVPAPKQLLAKLANERSDAVYQYLIAEGIQADRLERTTLQIAIGADMKKPLVRLEIIK